MTTIETHTQATNGKMAHTSSLVPFSELSEKLAMLRNKLGLSQREMGELLGVSHGCISLWERGHPPHGPNMAMLRKFLKQNWNEVMGRGQGLKQAEPKEEQAELDYAKRDEPQTFTLQRYDDTPLRFTGFKLGTLLMSNDSSLDLYKTKGGLIVWVCDSVNYGTLDHFVKNFNHTGYAGEVFAFANACGLEIFEDIE